jgi:molybdopterin-guanine dinucleotide biosynthesis protein A
MVGMRRPIGLVLSGGTGSRLGRDKGSLQLGGRTLADRGARVLAPLCSEVLISIRVGGSNPAPAFAAVEDGPPPGRGPLAGILAALGATRGRDLLVVACDYPRVDRDLLRSLLAAARPTDDLLFPVDSSGRDHPLVGIWRRRTEIRIRDALEAGRFRVGALVAELAVRRLGAGELGDRELDAALINVNRQSDLEQARGHDAP